MQVSAADDVEEVVEEGVLSSSPVPPSRPAGEVVGCSVENESSAGDGVTESRLLSTATGDAGGLEEGVSSIVPGRPVLPPTDVEEVSSITHGATPFSVHKVPTSVILSTQQLSEPSPPAAEQLGAPHSPHSRTQQAPLSSIPGKPLLQVDPFGTSGTGTMTEVARVSVVGYLGPCCRGWSLLRVEMVSHDVEGGRQARESHDQGELSSQRWP